MNIEELTDQEYEERLERQRLKNIEGMKKYRAKHAQKLREESKIRMKKNRIRNSGDVKYRYSWPSK